MPESGKLKELKEYMENTNISENTNNYTSTKTDLVAGFSGETMTLAEALKLSGKSKVTLLKIINSKDNRVPIVGKVMTGGRGRPANLYDRNKLQTAISMA